MTYANLQTNKFVTLSSYAEAEAHFNNTKPIRGRTKDNDGVPLRCDRRYHQSYRLLKLNNPTDQTAKPAYAARLYRTDVVTFFHDGSVMLDIGYNSTTTADFASHFLPHGFSCHLFAGKCVLSEHRTKQHYVCKQKVGLALNLTTDPLTNTKRYEVARSTVPPMYVQKVDKKRGAAARKLVKPLLDYCQTLAALGPISMETFQNMRGDNNGPRWGSLVAPTLNYLTDDTNFPKLAATFYSSRSYYQGKHYTPDPICVINDKRAKAEILDAAYRLTDAYYKDLLPYGKVHRKMQFYVTV